ncbi:hypothetical protein [Streptomyces sp. NPDC002328]|uniref:hypothetical protein n=1 Tax=Streptomyces sp. NPDC002328 TaxID=3364642 RepID=UPI0036C99C39
MITPADDFDDGPRDAPDDPLAVIMRPAAGHLAPPPGRYEEIRRGAARRRVLRAVAGVGATCAVAAAVVLPLRLSASQDPVAPVGPLAPPPASSPATGGSARPTAPAPSPSGSAASPAPVEDSRTPVPDRSTAGAMPVPESDRVPPSGPPTESTTEATTGTAAETGASVESSPYSTEGVARGRRG